MTKGIVGLLQSKKFLALAAGVVSLIATRYGLDAEAAKELVLPIAGMVAAYIGAQGLADMGKEKAKAEKALPELPPGLSGLLSMVSKLPAKVEPASEEDQ